VLELYNNNVVKIFSLLPTH